jgi:hypothetical protein
MTIQSEEGRPDFGPTREDLLSDPVLQSFIRDDDRWTGSNQLRDWSILFAIGALHFSWMFMVFLLEPGIR